MDTIKLKKELDRIYFDISDANFHDANQIKEALFRTIGFIHNLISELDKTTTQ
jgi:hypothetical protein